MRQYIDEDGNEVDGTQQEPMNGWDVLVVVARLFRDISQAWAMLFHNISGALENTSAAHDEKKMFAREAGLSIERITSERG